MIICTVPGSLLRGWAGWSLPSQSSISTGTEATLSWRAVLPGGDEGKQDRRVADTGGAGTGQCDHGEAVWYRALACLEVQEESGREGIKIIQSAILNKCIVLVSSSTNQGETRSNQANYSNADAEQRAPKTVEAEAA